MSWKSVLPSSWHILVCALQEASGEFERVEEGISFDSAPQSGGRSCKVDRSCKRSNPHQVPVDTAVEVGLGWALTVLAKVATNHRAWQVRPAVMAADSLGNLDLGMTRRLGPSVPHTVILVPPPSQRRHWQVYQSAWARDELPLSRLMERIFQSLFLSLPF